MGAVAVVWLYDVHMTLKKMNKTRNVAITNADADVILNEYQG